jgi:hypothetical protein
MSDTQMIFLKCPCCGQSRKAKRTGAFARQQGRVFDRLPESAPLAHLDPETEPFVDFRDGAGGRGRGFPRLRSLTLAEAARDSDWREHARRIVAWARRLVALGDQLGL